MEVGLPWLSTTCPLAIVTVTEWVPSLNVSVPLSSAASPLIARATAEAPALPIGVVDPLSTSTLGCSLRSWSTVTVWLAVAGLPPAPPGILAVTV